MTRQPGAYYEVYMSITLTVRTDEELRRRLEERARAQGRTVSELVRDILRDALEEGERPLESRIGHLRGRLEVRRSKPENWRKTLRERNWRW